jgi:hypothetical protein
MLREKIIYFQNRIIAFILIALAALNFSCQRDDICPETTLTTPLLKIAFFDAENTDSPKAPVNLTIQANGVEDVLFNRINQNEISIPLRVDSDLTEYTFTINTPATQEEEDNSNTDVIKFSYNREEIYINRACSFKVNYLDLNPITASTTEDTDKWIKTIIVEEPNVQDETITHISIFH